MSMSCRRDTKARLSRRRTKIEVRNLCDGRAWFYRHPVYQGGLRPRRGISIFNHYREIMVINELLKLPPLLSPSDLRAAIFFSVPCQKRVGLSQFRPLARCLRVQCIQSLLQRGWERGWRPAKARGYNDRSRARACTKEFLPFSLSPSLSFFPL